MRARYSLRSLSDISAITFPATVTSPLSTVSSPDRQFNSVVLPEPLGPITETISPLSTLMSTPSKALTSTSRVR